MSSGDAVRAAAPPRDQPTTAIGWPGYCLRGEFDGGPDVVLLKVSKRDGVAGAFAVAAEVEHHDGVAGRAKELGAIDHVETRAADRMREHDHAARIVGGQMPGGDFCPSRYRA